MCYIIVYTCCSSGCRLVEFVAEFITVVSVTLIVPLFCCPTVPPSHCLIVTLSH